MNDEDYINRCIELAIKGKGKVSTNPMVGAVIVYNDTIIGEGFYEFYGGPHAEVNAINNVADPSLLEHSTIYVSLEPCSHHGKTPPCSQLIIEKKIKRVVIGCVDTYSEVAGRGIEHLKQAGIEVKVGVLENECLFLNRRFFTFHEKKRPYVILKWVQSKDGFIDKKRTTSTREVNWISQPETQLKVHQWRSEEDAILVGKNTAINDNPQLTTRKFKGENPKRILLDSNLEVDLNSHIFWEDAPTFVINLKQSTIEKNTTWIQVADMSPASILKELYKLDIQSVIIEGGKATIDSFMKTNLWDEARVIEGTILFEEGLKAPTIQSPNTTTFSLGKDNLSVYLNDSLIPLKNIHYDFI